MHPPFQFLATDERSTAGSAGSVDIVRMMVYTDMKTSKWMLHADVCSGTRQSGVRRAAQHTRSASLGCHLLEAPKAHATRKNRRLGWLALILCGVFSETIWWC